MFYSHEILTSPEHGVATIWLVATLGSRSIARRLNRRAILDVDVPNACRVIINPEVPMALRLQGSLLYGVSRVYSQQCGYTLLDTQAMHDKMISKLKIIVGSGLDPDAGQTKPSNLILPYDPSFLPETGLPGLDIDLSYFAPINDSSHLSSLWTTSPVNSLSGISQLSSLRLDLPSEDIMGEDTIMGLDDLQSAKNKNVVSQLAGLGLEEGVLLQPDFEFDEDGNLVELEKVLSPLRHPKSPGGRSNELSEIERSRNGRLSDDQMVIDDQALDVVDGVHAMEIDKRIAADPIQEDSALMGLDDMMEIEPVRKRRLRQQKELITDETTSLRSLTLGQWNNEYVANMARARKQKQLNKIQTTSKKNAAFWVFGQGIGSVGVGLGMNHESHPLNMYSGESLFEAARGYQGQKRTRTDDDDNNSEGRRVRAREEDQLSRANLDRLNMDVEIGRDAPSSLLDDRSSQMPWNITASIKSSLRAHRFGSVSETSRKARSRLQSASPLAGRGYLDRMSMDLDLGDDLDLTRYLEGELATDREHISSISPGKRSALEHAKATLDRESLNFFDFMKFKMGIAVPTSPRSNMGSPVAGRLDRITFATLMPQESTTRAVATQALVNVLTLATKGVIRLHQDRNGAGWGGDGYGEIHLRFSGI